MKIALTADRKGFTIVELLIVIVVITILATISIVAYRGVQDRTRNSTRLHDAAAIVKALELYKIQYGSYPSTNSSGQNSGAGGWEISSRNPGTFLQALKTSGIMSKVPVDPVNTGDTDITGSKIYMYYVYSAGSHDCDASRGPYYVFIALFPDGGVGRDPSAPGFSCPSRSWNSGFYSIGRFTN